MKGTAANSAAAALKNFMVNLYLGFGRRGRVSYTAECMLFVAMYAWYMVMKMQYSMQKGIWLDGRRIKLPNHWF